MEKFNEKEKYYGVLMQRILINTGIFLFKPMCLSEGKIEINEYPENIIFSDDEEDELDELDNELDDEDDKNIFIDYLFRDTNNECCYYLSEDVNTLNEDCELSIAYVISEKELLEKYPEMTLKEAKIEYFDEIIDNAHIGFYILTDDKIVIKSYDFNAESLKLNQENLPINNELKQQYVNVQMNGNENFNAFLITQDKFEQILNLKTYEEMKKEIQILYDYFVSQVNDEIKSKEEKIIEDNIDEKDIKTLYLTSYDAISTIKNKDDLKKLLDKLTDIYMQLSINLDKKKRTKEVEIAQNYLYSIIDKYEEIIKMDNFNRMKAELEVVKSPFEHQLDEIVRTYETAKEAKEKSNEKQDLKELLVELEGLIGLENVKEFVSKLTEYLIFLKKVEGKVDLKPFNLNMVFKGNPGTGKTTVARIISKILHKLGYTNEKFAETTAQDFIAGYVGQTAMKAKNKIKTAEGGVIFVDEAYVFAAEAQNFAEEALVEIIKEMEKNTTVFIFAGYTKEMEQFANMNPGFKSRVGSFIDFKDYTVEQLYEIFENKVKNSKLIIGEGVKETVIQIIKNNMNTERFGNGRFIDRIFEKAVMEHAYNNRKTRKLSSLKTLTVKDFENIDQSLKDKVKVKLGF